MYFPKMRLEAFAEYGLLWDHEGENSRQSGETIHSEMPRDDGEPEWLFVVCLRHRNAPIIAMCENDLMLAAATMYSRSNVIKTVHTKTHANGRDD
jgi:hypothetical protein